MFNEYLTGAHKITVRKFYREWKKSWKSTNLIGIALLTVIYSCYWYFDYLITLNNTALNLIGLSLLPFAFLVLHLYICTCLICSTGHYDHKTIMTKSIRIMVTAPYIPLIFLTSFLVCMGIYYLMPIVGIILFLSPPLLLTTYLFNKKLISEDKTHINK